MSATVASIQELFSEIGVQTIPSPDSNALLAMVGGVTGKYTLAIQVDPDGDFLQIRTLSLVNVGDGHPRHPAVLRTINMSNMQTRYLKVAWDPKDGEVMFILDLMLARIDPDKTLIERFFHIFLSTLGLAHGRILCVLAGLDDPGHNPIRVFQALSKIHPLPDEFLAGLGAATDGPDEL